MTWLLAFSLSLCVAQAKELCLHELMGPREWGALDSMTCEKAALEACLPRAVQVCKLGTESQRCRRPVTIQPGEGGR